MRAVQLIFTSFNFNDVAHNVIDTGRSVGCVKVGQAEYNFIFTLFATILIIKGTSQPKSHKFVNKGATHTSTHPERIRKRQSY